MLIENKFEFSPLSFCPTAPPFDLVLSRFLSLPLILKNIGGEGKLECCGQSISVISLLEGGGWIERACRESCSRVNETRCHSYIYIHGKTRIAE